MNATPRQRGPIDASARADANDGSPLTSDLPERLRLGTRDLHVRSERSGVMAELLGRRMGCSGYCALLRNLHAIYAALEAGLTGSPHGSWLSDQDLAALRREAAIAADLDFLHGPDWRTGLTVVPAATQYVQRLQDAAPLLPAHAYVRYLGDLYGGQMLKRLIAQSLGLGPADAAAATHFYGFGDEAQVQQLRASLRQALAGLPVNEELAQQLLAEARWSFEQHILLFEELAVQPEASLKLS
jgi:heme oxygenase